MERSLHEEPDTNPTARIRDAGHELTGNNTDRDPANLRESPGSPNDEAAVAMASGRNFPSACEIHRR